MYVCIFRAQIKELDDEYREMAERMRSLAMNAYGCTRFSATTEGNTEIALSYWDSLDDIQAWKANAEHLKAQSKGRSNWYQSYEVQITEVIRSYDFSIPE